MQKQRSLPNRRKFLGFALAGGGIAVAAYLGIDALTDDNRSRDAGYDSLPLTYENAVKTPQVRQKYLDKLFEERMLEGEAWMSFSEFVYDPDFEKVKKRYGIDPTQYVQYGGKDLLLGATTMAVEEFRGKPAPVHFGEVIFACDPRYVTSEEDLKSVIDNESFHAILQHQSIIELPLPPEFNDLGILPHDIQVKILEALSFEKQISRILTVRRVSSQFKRNTYNTYGNLYQELSRDADENAEGGRILRPVLNAFRVKPVRK